MPPVTDFIAVATIAKEWPLPVMLQIYVEPRWLRVEGTITLPGRIPATGYFSHAVLWDHVDLSQAFVEQMRTVYELVDHKLKDGAAEAAGQFDA